MKFSGSDFKGFFYGDDDAEESPRSRREVRPAKTGKGRTLVNIAVTLAVGAVYFYVTLPALNLKNEGFYMFILLLCAVYGGCAVLTSGFRGDGLRGYFRFLKKQCAVPFVLAVVCVLTYLVGNLLSWEVLRAKDYRDLLQVETGDFAAEVKEVSYDQIPMLDKDSAQRLGDRKLGELADMVSQFEVASDYTQINYQDRPVRVTPLVYGDWIKWFVNRSEGLPAYLIIDMVTQNVEVVRLDEGIRYTTAEHFGRLLQRYLRFAYPTYMFSQPMFEIDEDGTPYWVCPKLDRTIGLFGGTDMDGAVLVNAVTGEHAYYEDVPTWVDHVYSAELIIEQYDYYGTYCHGFINSIFGQRDVTVTTAGYNYIAMNDDVYMYTGITSVSSDESNVGFILANQRTKETRFYSVAGAEEFSAEASAEGQVQHLNYDATFPLLLNIADQPTYFMALKDNAGLVKLYAMVNVQQYQIVATGQTVAECEESYRQMLAQNKLIDDSEAELAIRTGADGVSGTIRDLRSAVIDGNTYYYILLDGQSAYFVVSAAEVPTAVLLNVGDSVQIQYYQAEDTADAALLDAFAVERG